MEKTLLKKIGMLIFLSLMVYIPIILIDKKVDERKDHNEHAKSAVAKNWTGAQRIFTPVLIIPYTTAHRLEPGWQGKTKKSVALQTVFPSIANGQFHIDNSRLDKGIYAIPVYQTKITLAGSFDAHAINEKINAIQRKENFYALGEPYISIYVSDLRGMLGSPELLIDNKIHTLDVGSGLERFPSGLQAKVALKKLASKDTVFNLKLNIRGMEKLTFVPLAEDVTILMNSNWPHPMFIGAALPMERKITRDGFSAVWQFSKFSNGQTQIFERCILENTCRETQIDEVGVTFLEGVDVYLKTERAMKYAMLFIGIIFIVFFVFEQMNAKRIHFIQYTFVGLAVAVFYLLLISLSEHIAYEYAYAMGALSCSLLMGGYVKTIFYQTTSAVLFLFGLLFLYGILFMITQSEDYALLMGSLFVFVVLACVMFVTRKVDWYVSK